MSLSTNGLLIDGLEKYQPSESTAADQTARRRSVRNPFQKNQRDKEKPQLRVRKNTEWGVVADKFWLDIPKSKKEKWASRIIYIGMALGVIGMAAFGVWGYFEGRLPATCVLIEDDFRYGTIDQNLWRHEISTGGGNAGSFEWTTDSADNSFVKDGQLHIRPTLVEAYPEGTVFNLTEDGTCTDPYFWCTATQNSTAYQTINPVKSAKLSTKLSMQYGEMQIRVKFPKGNWIWSQIQLNPSDNFYGSYPANGQVVVAQTRGNDYKYAMSGNNNLDSFLAFGPDGHIGQGKTLSANKELKFTTFSDDFHVIGIQWTPTHIRTWLDDPANTILLSQWYKFGGFWKKGGWQEYLWPGIFDPWAVAYPSWAAPFDRNFYLSIQVGVGGMNGIFNVDQPWELDAGRDKALSEFRAANTTWYPEWPENDDRDLIVDYVKMRKQCYVAPIDHSEDKSPTYNPTPETPEG